MSTHTLDLDISPKRKISFSLHVLSHIHKTRKCCFSAEVLSVSVDPSASSMVPRFYTHTFCRLELSYHKGKQKKKNNHYHILFASQQVFPMKHGIKGVVTAQVCREGTKQPNA